MSTAVSTSKQAELLTAVQLNPEIGADDSEFINSVIQRASRFLVSQVHLDRYPELAQGYSESGGSAATDLESTSTNELLIALDGDDYHTITMTLAGLTTGAAIATEIQAKIRAVGTGDYKFITCDYDGSTGKYIITSPTYGEQSSVSVSYNAEAEHVSQELKFSETYGGVERVGGNGDIEYDDMVIALVTHWYNRVGVEGMKSYSVPGSGSYTEHDIDPAVHSFIQDNRRIIY
jgi:hypothetical protein